MLVLRRDFIATSVSSCYYEAARIHLHSARIALRRGDVTRYVYSILDARQARRKARIARAATVRP